MIKNNKILFLVVAIEYVFIALLIFIILGVGNTYAQSLTWTNPTYLSINNGYPGQNIELQSDNSLLVGSIGGSKYGMYTWAIYQINKNNINSNWQTLDKSNYNITFESTIHTRYDVGNTLIKLMVFDNGTQYTATCDEGEEVSFERYSDNSNRYKFRYSCKKLNVNLDNVTFISIGVKSNDYTIDYHLVTSNLRLIDNNLELSNKDIIENQNQNAQDIINNLNQNAQDIVDAIQGGELEDTEEVDKEKLEEYEEIENELLNKENLDNIKDIKIDVDSDALEYVFELLTRIVNTHQLIYGLIITMLSLGVIKLILNR